MRINEEAIKVLLDEKFDFLTDRLLVHITNVGLQWDYEIETQHSLFEKVNFQIKNDNKYRFIYLDNYFNHPILFEDFLWEDYKSFAYLKGEMTRFSASSDKEEKRRIIDSASFQKKLLAMETELKHKMSDNLLKKLFRVFNCNKGIFEHDHLIELDIVAKLYISQGFYTGKTKKELRKMIANVVKPNIETFPFPVNLKNAKQRKEYFREMTFEKKLRGFSNILSENSQHGLVLTKVYGGILPEDYEFKYDGVIFFGNKNEKIEKIKKEVINHTQKNPFKKHFLEVFSSDDSFFMATSISWSFNDSISGIIKNKTTNQVNYLSTILKRNFNVDNTNNFILLDSKFNFKRIFWSTQKFNHPFSEEDLKSLHNNGFSALKTVKTSEAKDWMMRFEATFINAFKSSNIAECWQYLETLFSTGDDEKRVRHIVSNLLLLNEKLIMERRILNGLINYFDIFNGANYLNISHKQLGDVHTELAKRIIPDSVRNCEIAQVKLMVKEFDSGLGLVEYRKAQNYYIRILIEAYGYRNFHVHSGLVNDKSLVKLEKTFPYLLTRIRWILFDKIRKAASKPFSILVEELVEEASLLTK